MGSPRRPLGRSQSHTHLPPRRTQNHTHLLPRRTQSHTHFQLTKRSREHSKGSLKYRHMQPAMNSCQNGWPWLRSVHEQDTQFLSSAAIAPDGSIFFSLSFSGQAGEGQQARGGWQHQHPPPSHLHTHHSLHFFKAYISLIVTMETEGPHCPQAGSRCRETSHVQPAEVNMKQPWTIVCTHKLVTPTR